MVGMKFTEKKTNTWIRSKKIKIKDSNGTLWTTMIDCEIDDGTVKSKTGDKKCIKSKEDHRWNESYKTDHTGAN